MSDTTPNLNGAGLDYFNIRTLNNRGLISITLPLYTDNLNTAVYTVCFFRFHYCMICLCPLHKSVIYILAFCATTLFTLLLGCNFLSINCCCKRMSSFTIVLCHGSWQWKSYSVLSGRGNSDHHCVQKLVPPYIPRWTLHCISELQQSKWVYSATSQRHRCWCSGTFVCTQILAH